MYGGENSGMPLGPDPVNNGTGTFGAENDYDQPAAIVSGGADGGAVAFDSSKSDKSSKYFGHRSREKAAKQSAPQVDMNLVAASNIANNPNNPEFFRQAAIDNTTAQIQRQPRQMNKKPIIIGGIVVAVIALICVAVTFVPKLFQQINDNKIAAVKIDAMEYYEDIEYYDSLVKMSEEGVYSLYGLIVTNEKDYNDTISALDKHLERSKELQKKLHDAKKSKTNDEDFDKKVAIASDALDKRVVIYEAYAGILKDVTEALYVNNAKPAKEILSNYNKQEVTTIANKIDEYRTNRKVLDDRFSQNGCSVNSHSDICLKTQDSLNTLNESFSNDQYINTALQSFIEDKDYKNDRMPILLREISEHNNGEEK